MRIVLAIMPLLVLAACSVPVSKPEHGHPFHLNNVTTFVRQIDSSSDLAIIEPEWNFILKRQPIVRGNGISTVERLRAINHSINSKQSFRHSPWMAPKEFYKASSADCKGYAVAKYYALRAAGWKASELNLWAGDYTGGAHLILVASVGNKQFVLDIIEQDLPEAKEYFNNKFIPSYRFNEVGLDIK